MKHFLFTLFEIAYLKREDYNKFNVYMHITF